MSCDLKEINKGYEEAKKLLCFDEEEDVGSTNSTGNLKNDTPTNNLSLFSCSYLT